MRDIVPTGGFQSVKHTILANLTMPGTYTSGRALCCIVLLASIKLFITGQRLNTPFILLSTPIVKISDSLCAAASRSNSFYGKRIPYYSNSDCTFQLELLKSGDVQTNPGPESGNGGLGDIGSTGHSNPQVPVIKTELTRVKICWIFVTIVIVWMMQF